MKIACVIHRYGAGIAGGSEAHCRAIAEHLAARHDVTVLTTTARDHVTWQNAFPPGDSHLGPVTVRRFPVRRPRSLHRFAEVSDTVFSGHGSEAEQELWFRENGPDAPGLLEHLERDGRQYDRVLFWAYRYGTTYFGLPLVAERAILVPTAEEDPAIRLDVLAPFFARPAGFVFLTPEERALVARRAERPLGPSCVIGCGLDPPDAPAPVHALQSLGIAQPFLLYLGRVDPNKGCEALVRDYLRYRAEAGEPAPLVMAGPANMPIPEHSGLRALGFVSPDTRDALLAHAAVLIVPSPYESLSMVLLEAWNRGIPALVNGGCAVLKGQVLRANGGLYYRSYDEFARGLTRLLTCPNDAKCLGAQGRDYVEREYRWAHVLNTLERFLDRVPSHDQAAPTNHARRYSGT